MCAGPRPFSIRTVHFAALQYVELSLTASARDRNRLRRAGSLYLIDNRERESDTGYIWPIQVEHERWFKQRRTSVSVGSVYTCGGGQD